MVTCPRPTDTRSSCSACFKTRLNQISRVAPEHVRHIQKSAEDASVCRNIKGIDHLRAESLDLDRKGVGEKGRDGGMLAAHVLEDLPADHPGLNTPQRAGSSRTPTFGQQECQFPEEVTPAQDGECCDIAEWGRAENLDKPPFNKVDAVSRIVLVKNHLVAIKRSPDRSLQKARSGKSVQALQHRPLHLAGHRYEPLTNCLRAALELPGIALPQGSLVAGC